MRFCRQMLVQYWCTGIILPATRSTYQPTLNTLVMFLVVADTAALESLFLLSHVRACRVPQWQALCRTARRRADLAVSCDGHPCPQRSRGHEADVNGLRLHAIRLPRCGGVRYASTQEAPRNARPRRTTRVRRSTLTRSGEYERRINRPLNANLSLVLETRPSRTAKWPEYTFSSLYDSSRSAS